MPRKIRIVVAKPGLESHVRGAKMIARALPDTGMGAIYTGLHRMSEQTVVQAYADAIGLSISSRAPMTLAPRNAEPLTGQADDVLPVTDDTVPSDDVPVLEQGGLAQDFTPRTPPDIVSFIERKLAARV